MTADNNPAYILEKYFQTYNRVIRQLSDSSVKHYCEAIKKISAILRQKNIIKDSLYEITDLDALENIMAVLDGLEEFKELDMRGHHMYSCGFKRYYEFASASNFKGVNINIFDDSSNIDIPPQIRTGTITTYKRSTILKNQVIASANFKCEINPSHKTFISSSSNNQYMEAHHIIHLKHQSVINHNLDIFSNVICLCPICHRLLHYGIEKDKFPVLSNIYNQRHERLKNSGLVLSKDDFFELTLRTGKIES